jgi:hypothetical protein
LIAVPVFDSDALLQWGDVQVPADDQARHALWNQLRADCVAAAEQIELLTVALAECRARLPEGKA